MGNGHWKIRVFDAKFKMHAEYFHHRHFPWTFKLWVYMRYIYTHIHTHTCIYNILYIIHTCIYAYPYTIYALYMQYIHACIQYIHEYIQYIQYIHYKYTILCRCCVYNIAYNFN